MSFVDPGYQQQCLDAIAILARRAGALGEARRSSTVDSAAFNLAITALEARVLRLSNASSRAGTAPDLETTAAFYVHEEGLLDSEHPWRIGCAVESMSDKLGLPLTILHPRSLQEAVYHLVLNNKQNTQLAMSCDLQLTRSIDALDASAALNDEAGFTALVTRELYLRAKKVRTILRSAHLVGLQRQQTGLRLYEDAVVPDSFAAYVLRWVERL